MSPLLQQLINKLQYLPGIGPKSAQRIAFYLLEEPRDKGAALAEAVYLALSKVGHCQHCRTFCETEICRICSNPKRDKTTLCIVETPADALAIEQTSRYNGHYFVLRGRLSPLDGIGPDKLGLPLLNERIKQKEVQEVIIATNPTLEGKATEHYIVSMLKGYSVHISRLAQGVPLDGELDYLDGSTLAHAIVARTQICTE